MRRTLAATLLLLVLASCAQVFGVTEGQLDLSVQGGAGGGTGAIGGTGGVGPLGGTGGVATGGTGPVGGNGGSSAGGAGGACATSTALDCHACQLCEEGDLCAAAWSACAGNARCAAMASCIATCSPISKTCASACADGVPGFASDTTANALVQSWTDCAGCGVCKAKCGGSGTVCENGGGGAGGGGAGGGGTGGTSSCDTGSCQACEACADGAACKPFFDGCEQSPSCKGLGDCLSKCNPVDSMCTTSCAKQFPGGVAQHDALTSCRACGACKISCPSMCASPCAHTECVVGSGLAPSCSLCAETVCDSQSGMPGCCNSGSWGLSCVQAAQAMCGLSCGAAGTGGSGSTCPPQGVQPNTPCSPQGANCTATCGIGCTCASNGHWLCTGTCGAGGSGGASGGASGGSGSGGAGGAQCGPSGPFPASTCTDTVGQCDACASCAKNTSPCASEQGTCLSNQDCKALADCASACLNPACIATCMDDHPNGVCDYRGVAACSESACPTSCGPTPAKCPAVSGMACVRFANLVSDTAVPAVDFCYGANLSSLQGPMFEMATGQALRRGEVTRLFVVPSGSLFISPAAGASCSPGYGSALKVVLADGETADIALAGSFLSAEKPLVVSRTVNTQTALGSYANVRYFDGFTAAGGPIAIGFDDYPSAPTGNTNLLELAFGELGGTVVAPSSVGLTQDSHGYAGLVSAFYARTSVFRKGAGVPFFQTSEQLGPINANLTSYGFGTVDSTGADRPHLLVCDDGKDRGNYNHCVRY